MFPETLQNLWGIWSLKQLSEKIHKSHILLLYKFLSLVFEQD